jgi:hypothetical protein
VRTDDRRVRDPEPLVLRLELDRNAEPISGRLRIASDHAEVSFTGWLALAAAIEQVLGDKPTLEAAGPS